MQLRVQQKDANGNDITFKLDTSKKYKLLDVTNSPVGADDDETIGTELFVRTGMSRYTKITLDHQVYSDSCVDSDGNPLGLAKRQWRWNIYIICLQ